MSPGWGAPVSFLDCFPRVSGDEPALAARYGLEGEFSPRERG